MENEHILVLGATGASGVAFIEAVEELTRKPKLTLYVRPGSRSKLPACAFNPPTRIIEGQLDDKQAMQKAMSTSASGESPSFQFPPVSVVVSFLGSYVSLKAVFTRDKSHPIADAFSTTIIPAMKASRVPRILALSTPSALSHDVERKSIPWKWWLYTCMPILLAPQGNAEMKGIARAVIDAGSAAASGDNASDSSNPATPTSAAIEAWTVFRVPHLTQGDLRAKVVAGLLDHDYAGSFDLSRGSLARWVLGEIEEKKFLNQLPMLANP
ncbi:hypothetical protein PV08_09783 [Exophiala spinifera]|uniref:NAD(P)-binding domain-containing protein n=1 Tax=Exophiala spinifera TaxID=91928 RepID=A0A0D1YCA3_9EURO|nr:uncharacterized protein PV08_09783 [Exophiala spinifera]KIW12506.1 hypothetical protein PV08_09783 [Exophiala spinifera]